MPVDSDPQIEVNQNKAIHDSIKYIIKGFAYESRSILTNLLGLEKIARANALRALQNYRFAANRVFPVAEDFSQFIPSSRLDRAYFSISHGISRLEKRLDLKYR